MDVKLMMMILRTQNANWWAEKMQTLCESLANNVFAISSIFKTLVV